MQRQPNQSHLLPEFPRKRCSAGALIRDQEGRLLIVKPVYRPEWLLPGGIAESNESPLAALIREVHEELGLKVEAKSLLCVDYLPADDKFTDAIHFLFDCGQIENNPANPLKPIDVELSEVRFVDWNEAQKLLAPSIVRRLANLSEGGYFEAGTPRLPFCTSGPNYEN